MAKTFSHNLTPEKLALKGCKEVELIRERATQHGATDLVAMCDNDLASRPVPSSPNKSSSSARKQAGHSDSAVVTGYHFVCGRDRGVTLLEQDRFRSGSWVVAEAEVRNSLKYGSYLALHESKSAPSYRQGSILDYRRTARDMLTDDVSIGTTKTEEGIEFLVQGTSEPYEWVGGGAGEKGYQWTEVVTPPSSKPNKGQADQP